MFLFIAAKTLKQSFLFGSAHHPINLNSIFLEKTSNTLLDWFLILKKTEKKDLPILRLGCCISSYGWLIITVIKLCLIKRFLHISANFCYKLFLSSVLGSPKNCLYTINLCLHNGFGNYTVGEL